MNIIHVEPRLRPYEPYFFDILGASVIGYGLRERVTPELQLARTWEAMINRCYNPTCAAYNRYGAKGVSVCKRWHQVATYILDVQKLHGWANKLADWATYELDKDYYSSNQYSPETCVWLSRKDNVALTGAAMYVTNAVGVKTLYLSQIEVSLAIGMAAESVGMYARRGTPIVQGSFIGYKFEYALDAKHMRYPLAGENNE